MKIIKKTFLLLVVFLFCTPILKVGALNSVVESYEQLNSAFKSDDTDKTIKLNKNIEMPNDTSLSVKKGQTVNLDLNGYTLKVTSTLAKGSSLISNAGTLTIKDSSDTKKDGTGTGKLLFYAEQPDLTSIPGYASDVIVNNGNLTIESGLIGNDTGKNREDTDAVASAAYAIDNYSSDSLLTINGGRIYTLSSCGIRLFVNSSTKGNSIIINDGIIEGYWGVQLQVAAANPKASVEINGGTILGQGIGFYLYDYSTSNNIDITINGGNISASTPGGEALYLYSAVADIEINDGVFEADYPLYYYSTYKATAPTTVINGGEFLGLGLIYQGFSIEVDTDYDSNIVINGGYFNDDIYAYAYCGGKWSFSTYTYFINGGWFKYNGNEYYWGYYVNKNFLPTNKMKTAEDKDYSYTIGHKITLNSNYDDTKNAVIYTTIDGKLSELYDLERENYEFIEWNTKKDGTGNVVTKDTIYTTNQEIYARWKGVPGTIIETDENIKVAVETDLVDMLITEDDKEVLDDDGTITINLIVEDMTEQLDEIKEEKEKIEEALIKSDYTMGQYIDISLIKKIEQKQELTEVKIEETEKTIKISIKIPEELINKDKDAVNRKYKIVRCHKDVVEFLDTEYDIKEETLTFETDKFSVYSIVYEDEVVNNPKTSDGVIFYGSIFLASILVIKFIGRKLSRNQ